MGRREKTAEYDQDTGEYYKGSLVRVFRWERGLKLLDLSERVGTTVKDLSMLELKDIGSPGLFESLAQELGCPPELLLGAPRRTWRLRQAEKMRQMEEADIGDEPNTTLGAKADLKMKRSGLMRGRETFTVEQATLDFLDSMIKTVIRSRHKK